MLVCGIEVQRGHDVSIEMQAFLLQILKGTWALCLCICCLNDLVFGICPVIWWQVDIVTHGVKHHKRSLGSLGSSKFLFVYPEAQDSLEVKAHTEILWVVAGRRRWRCESGVYRTGLPVRPPVKQRGLHSLTKMNVCVSAFSLECCQTHRVTISASEWHKWTFTGQNSKTYVFYNLHVHELSS